MQMTLAFFPSTISATLLPSLFINSVKEEQGSAEEAASHPVVFHTVNVNVSCMSQLESD